MRYMLLIYSDEQAWKDGEHASGQTCIAPTSARRQRKVRQFIAAAQVDRRLVPRIHNVAGGRRFPFARYCLAAAGQARFQHENHSPGHRSCLRRPLMF